MALEAQNTEGQGRERLLHAGSISLGQFRNRQVHNTAENQLIVMCDGREYDGMPLFSKNGWVFPDTQSDQEIQRSKTNR